MLLTSLPDCYLHHHHHHPTIPINSILWDKVRYLTSSYWELFQSYHALPANGCQVWANRLWPLYILLLGVFCPLFCFPVKVPFIITLHRIELDSWPWTICSTHYSFNSCQFTYHFPQKDSASSVFISLPALIVPTTDFSWAPTCLWFILI